MSKNDSTFEGISPPEKATGGFPVVAVVLGSLGIILLVAITIMLCYIVFTMRRRADEQMRRRAGKVDGWALVIAELKQRHHTKHGAQRCASVGEL
ncbi:hypothetical protein niasHT_040027 [Heterodera trifolii]|uniref:Uncharacterized protein n=1 Tax=Heterodera trifolii TaxID=157864 RepID=A0ABD2J662_9BILA